MIKVESMSPTTMRTVWALRRGMLRIPILKMTGRRRATQATLRRQMPSRMTNTVMMPLIGTPKISLIGTP
jgi:hypothetical protein